MFKGQQFAKVQKGVLFQTRDRRVDASGPPALKAESAAPCCGLAIANITA